MNAQVAWLLWSVGAAAAVIAVVKFPRHILQSAMIARTWQLLDELDSSIRRGDLPSSSAEVRRLRELIYRFAKSADRVRVMDLVAINLARKQFPDGNASRIPTAPPALSKSQRELFTQYRDRITFYSPFIALTGTWVGLLVLGVGAFHVVVSLGVRHLLRRRAEKPPTFEQNSLVDWSMLTLRAEAEEHEASRGRHLVGAA